MSMDVENIGEAKTRYKELCEELDEMRVYL